MPATIPPPFTVATGRLLLLHAPPAGAAANVVVLCAQKIAVPVIAPGLALTVTTADLVHVLAPVAIMVAVPALMPPTVPVPAPTVATAVLLLLHAAPADVSAVVAPTHTVSAPPIAAGAGSTVATLVATQPEVGNV